MLTFLAVPTSATGTPFDARSPQAAAIAELFTRSLATCGAVLAVVTVLVLFCLIRFRADGMRQPSTTEGHSRLEIAWTIAPVLVLAWLLVLTVRAMAASDPPAKGDADVVVIGHQWWWEVRYPSGAVTANEVHVPIGKPLAFRVESADVIHDFWVPQLGRKIDAIPGRPASIWLGADRPGTYLGACAEYCGAEHAWMRIVVVAEPQDVFEAWERHQLAPAAVPLASDAVRGARAFGSMTCTKCHEVTTDDYGRTSARFGPDLTHFGTRATLGAGVRPNTSADLGQWLTDPQLVKPGCHMPNAQLTQTQIADLVAYLGSLL